VTLARSPMDNPVRHRPTCEPAMVPGLHSEITCPRCGHRKVEPMPTDACQFFYECTGCSSLLRPKPGDCCVFCS
jgi:hypothetical protein